MTLDNMPSSPEDTSMSPVTSHEPTNDFPLVKNNAITFDSRPRRKSLHIAPMMDVTTREFRYLMRLFTKHAILWTEMVVDETIVHCRDRRLHLGFDRDLEPPVVCQIGGNNPEAAMAATKIVVEEFGYEAIDLNCACPSRKVCGERAFGAALMLHQQLAVDMIQSIHTAAQECARANDTEPVHISIKTRVGVDDQDDLDFLVDYIRRLRPYCRRFVLHARKVHTKGLSPVQNRNVPPLNYPRVYAICRHFPDCDFVINGGIQTVQEAWDLCNGVEASDSDTETVHDQLPCLICRHPNGSCTAPPSRGRVPSNLRGAMIGRAIRDNPCILAHADLLFYRDTNHSGSLPRSRRQVLHRYCEYLERVYPRRCCDDDSSITMAMSEELDRKGLDSGEPEEFCSLCSQLYADRNGGFYQGPAYWKGENGWHEVTEHSGKGRVFDSLAEEMKPMKALTAAQPPKAKIAGHIIDRSIKPILGIFYGKRGSSMFRRKLEALSKDPWIRNCGPGAMVRMAMNSMDDALLDEEFDDPTKEPAE